jgi:ABC-type polysaccharide/polyol phosphate export permease
MVVVAGSGIVGDAAAEWPPAPSRAAAAWRDLSTGFAKHWVWTALAMQDIRLRYRGSVLGPFWMTISTLVMVVAMGVVYAHLFRTDSRSYVPYLTLGLVVWQLLSNLITEGCNTFIHAENVIQQVPIPFSIYAYRAVCRNLIVLAHSLVIVPFVMLFFAVPVGWSLCEAVAGIALLAVDGVWISLFLGMLSVRFRDVPPIVASFLQVCFFMTPVFWPIEALGRWQPIAELNPLFAAIDVVRAPLVGRPIAPYSWAVLLLATAIGAALTFALFARFRSRIAYWV